MSDSWNDLQAIRHRQNTLRAKMMERRKQREDIVAELSNSSGGAPAMAPAAVQVPNIEQPVMPGLPKATQSTAVIPAKLEQMKGTGKLTADPEVEKKLLMVLCDISLDIPSDSKVITEHTSRLMEREVDLLLIEGLLKKFAAQKLISIKFTEGVEGLIVNSLDLTKLSAMTKGQSKKRRRDSDDEEEEEQGSKQVKAVPGPETGDIESLLSMQSTKEREEKKLNEEIQALLVTQTAKEQYLVEKFKSRGGPQLQEFCQYGTREECQRTGPEGANCKRLHFKKIIHEHTDESLGDCSFLNTCFHMDICKDPSSKAANVAGTTDQHILSGPVQQHPVQSWYYNYENNDINNLYSSIRQGPSVNRSYPHIPDASSAISDSSTISSGPYMPSPVQNSLHVSGRHLPSSLAPSGIGPDRQYLSSNPSVDTLSEELNRPPGLNVRDLAVRQFHMLNNSNISGGSHLSGIVSIPQQPDVSADARNDLSRSYHHLSGTDPGVTPALAPTLQPEMPAATIPYSSIPYSLTAPPPAPTASAVTSPPFTQIGDLPSFDTGGPVISYSWSIQGGDLFSNAAPPLETKSSPKTIKPKNVVNSGKKRVRRPEMWKKNVTKTKKLKGEEHVSRTGNVIPAKRVEKVDCSNCSFKCHENFTEDLRRQLFEVFYSLGSNESQKQFVCQNVQESATKIAGSNKKEGVTENKRKVCRKYFLPDTDNTRKQVCSKFFCRTLAIGKTFITHALRNKQFGCYIGKEKRGKPHNKIPDLLLEPARQHISSMLAGPSGGSKKKKKCLERGLNITKMHEMYKQECSDKNITAVSLSMYRRVFHTEF